MPLGETIGELILRPVLELVLYGAGYWTGFAFLKAVTFGVIRLAPFSSMGEKNRNRRKWHETDWSVWLFRPMEGRMLKAECTILVGVLIWAVAGCSVYFAIRGEEPVKTKATFHAPRLPLVGCAGSG